MISAKAYDQCSALLDTLLDEGGAEEGSEHQRLIDALSAAMGPYEAAQLAVAG